MDLWVTLLEAGERRALALRPDRHAWVHVARGSAAVNGTVLGEGDGAAVSGEEALTLVGRAAGRGPGLRPGLAAGAAGAERTPTHGHAAARAPARCA